MQLFSYFIKKSLLYYLCVTSNKYVAIHVYQIENYLQNNQTYLAFIK